MNEVEPSHYPQNKELPNNIDVEKRLKEMEKCIRIMEIQLQGVFKIMEDYMTALDRETGQIWEYVLSKKEGPK